MKFLTIGFVIAVTSMSAIAAAGPFGLEQGMSLVTVGGNPEPISKGIYKFKSVPKPHPAFESYVLQFGPTSGLCWIKAIGPNVSTNVYGSDLKIKFDELKNRLSDIYGFPEEFDLLLPRSIWREPNEWMTALVKKERVLASRWQLDKAINQKHELKTVFLGASALSDDLGYLAVEYYFPNYDQCESEIKRAEDETL
jgi:hypothetical protein